MHRLNNFFPGSDLRFRPDAGHVSAGSVTFGDDGALGDDQSPRYACSLGVVLGDHGKRDPSVVASISRERRHDDSMRELIVANTKGREQLGHGVQGSLRARKMSRKGAFEKGYLLGGG